MGVGNEVDERVRRNEGAADWIGFDELVARLYGMCVCADGWMDTLAFFLSFSFLLYGLDAVAGFWSFLPPFSLGNAPPGCT